MKKHIHVKCLCNYLWQIAFMMIAIGTISFTAGCMHKVEQQYSTTQQARQ